AWCAVEVTTDRQWQALAAALGWHDWAADRELAGLAGRELREAEIEARMRSSLQGREVDEVVEALTARGVPAARVATSADIAEDRQLAARGYWHRVRHAEMGEVLANVPPFSVVGEARTA